MHGAQVMHGARPLILAAHEWNVTCGTGFRPRPQGNSKAGGILAVLAATAPTPEREWQVEADEPDPLTHKARVMIITEAVDQSLGSDPEGAEFVPVVSPCTALAAPERLLCRLGRAHLGQGQQRTERCARALG